MSVSWWNSKKFKIIPSLLSNLTQQVTYKSTENWKGPKWNLGIQTSIHEMGNSKGH